MTSDLQTFLPLKLSNMMSISKYRTVLNTFYCDVLCWSSPGTPASCITKTGRHDIAEILLKVALKHQKSINQTKLDLPRNKNVDI